MDDHEVERRRNAPGSSGRSDPDGQSGPAGGMLVAQARALAEPNLLTLDMGGTSADVGMILEGPHATPPSTRSSGVCRPRFR